MDKAVRPNSTPVILMANVPQTNSGREKHIGKKHGHYWHMTLSPSCVFVRPTGLIARNQCYKDINGSIAFWD